MNNNNVIEKIQQIKGEISPLFNIEHSLSKTLNLQGKLSKVETIGVQLLHVDGTIKGSLTNTLSISGSLSKIGNVSGQLSTERVDSDVEYYKGIYSVTPLADKQTILKTKHKNMIDDVTVLEIPYYVTSNQSDGYTVIIS